MHILLYNNLSRAQARERIWLVIYSSFTLAYLLPRFNLLSKKAHFHLIKYSYRLVYVCGLLRLNKRPSNLFTIIACCFLIVFLLLKKLNICSIVVAVFSIHHHRSRVVVAAQLVVVFVTLFVFSISFLKSFLFIFGSISISLFSIFISIMIDKTKQKRMNVEKIQ